jgi:hypothetical protein
MFKGIANWFKSIISPNKVKSLATIVFPTNQQIVSGKVYLNDPTNPDLVTEEINPEKTILSMRAIGEQGVGYPMGSIQQQALALKIMVNDSLNYMASKSPKQINHWSSVKSLNLICREGKDINAYYDRGALKFFYFGDIVRQKNIYACDSRPVVCHEFGHAFLDILRPDFWSAQSAEVWAFSEAFGDMTAILSMIQFDKLLQRAIEETHGDLLKSNIITRMASEMGSGLYHLTNGQNGELPYCLRDLSNDFKYVQPEKLPTEGRDDEIINECHSFSRIFSGAFYELLIKMANQNSELPIIDAIKSASDTLANYLLKAVATVPLTVRLFEAMCNQMMQIDKAEGGKYQNIMTEVFTKRNLISAQVMTLEDIDMETFIKDVKEPHEIQVHGENKIVRTLSTKNIKLSEKLEIFALEKNELFNLEIEVPNQAAYYFNEENKLVNIVEADENEIVDAAHTCLHILNMKNLVGEHENALFQEENGKLVRKQIVCKCNKPNYCDPNAPEYNKPWKPVNNSGCVSCVQRNCKPRSCDCNPVEKVPPPKLGCYTTVSKSGTKTYRYGSSASRKVC